MAGGEWRDKKRKLIENEAWDKGEESAKTESIGRRRKRGEGGERKKGGWKDRRENSKKVWEKGRRRVR